MDPLNIDYSLSDLCIREAMTDAVSIRAGDGVQSGPPRITWDGHSVLTGDMWDVPHEGRLTITIEGARPYLRQGIEIQVPGGGLCLLDGTLLPRMHMWSDEGLPDSMTYPYVAPGGKILSCNVYEQTLDGRYAPRVKRWGDWAGMWIEEPSVSERIYHCNLGNTNPPRFEDLVYRLTVE
ncbi:hypothetical protein [Streptacidiphilus melanogenes]|uniref:hypothetical protein n=1 Tax=Streptacidiphilus melanogenes TaxID=411235 RepID=UPI0005AA06C5|nr:hypothetical protein [Streptacidiphilus melanogenes]